MQLFKVASLNANSIRARLSIILDWLANESPDVFCLQETKVQDQDFPADAIRDAGYHVVYAGRKSYNGVAIVSRTEPEQVRVGLDDWGEPGEGRLIAARIRGVSIVNTYVPHGQSPSSERFAYKLAWLGHLRDYFARHHDPEQPLLWAGNFNIAPEPMDIYDPEKLAGHIGYHPEEHRVLEYIKGWGFEDVFRRHVPEGGHYTFWDYRVPNVVKRRMGWRIDHIWATRPLAERSRSAWIDVAPRMLPRPSDHTFIVAEFETVLSEQFFI